MLSNPGCPVPWESDGFPWVWFSYAYESHMSRSRRIYVMVYPAWTCGTPTPTVEEHSGMRGFEPLAKGSATPNPLYPSTWEVWTPDRGFLSNPSNQLYPMVPQLLRCDGKSAGAGGLIDGDKTMLFLGMINGGNTTLLLACAGELINGRVTTLLLMADQRFG